jgi:hypothetical protein
MGIVIHHENIQLDSRLPLKGIEQSPNVMAFVFGGNDHVYAR